MWTETLHLWDDFVFNIGRSNLNRSGGTESSHLSHFVNAGILCLNFLGYEYTNGISADQFGTNFKVTFAIV